MPVFEKAKVGVYDLVKSIMKKYHGKLHDAAVEVDVLMVSPTTNSAGETTGPPLKRNGVAVPAIMKIVALPERALGQGDAQLKLDESQWKISTDKQKAALIDHELTRLELKSDGDGSIVMDDLHRPKLQIRRHDREIHCFDEVIRRHERDAYEWQAFDAMAKALTQMNLKFMAEVG